MSCRKDTSSKLESMIKRFYFQANEVYLDEIVHQYKMHFISEIMQGAKTKGTKQTLSP
jgi:hypothetical protein